MGFIYLIKLTKHTNLNVYKIGMSNQNELKMRLNGYGKLGIDYVIEYYMNVDFTSETEKEIIQLFKEHFILFEGREYFMGNCNEMINIIKPFQCTLKQNELKDNTLRKDSLTLKDKNKSQLISIIEHHHVWFNKINENSRFTIFDKQNCDYWMSEDKMLYAMSDDSEEIEQLKKQIEEKDEKIKQIEEDKQDIFLKHMIKYNILEEPCDYKEPFDYSQYTSQESSYIFDNIFKWLDNLHYLENINKDEYDLSDYDLSDDRIDFCKVVYCLK